MDLQITLILLIRNPIPVLRFPRALLSISFLHLRFIRALGVNLLSREGNSQTGDRIAWKIMAVTLSEIHVEILMLL